MQSVISLSPYRVTDNIIKKLCIVKLCKLSQLQLLETTTISLKRSKIPV